MTQLSTRMSIPAYGDDDLDLIVEYEYNRRAKELSISSCDADIAITRVPVWHLLTMRQRDTIEDRCREDYVDRMDAVREQRYGERYADN